MKGSVGEPHLDQAGNCNGHNTDRIFNRDRHYPGVRECLTVTLESCDVAAKELAAVRLRAAWLWNARDRRPVSARERADQSLLPATDGKIDGINRKGFSVGTKRRTRLRRRRSAANVTAQPQPVR